MSQGPSQRNKDEVVYRTDGMLHAGSARAVRDPRKTAYFFRCRQSEFQDIERLISELGFRNRADFVAECVRLMALISKAAADAGYRDRIEFTAHSIESLNCLLKRSPIPTWAHLEAAPALLPPPTAEPSRS
jgi:hypothetical protein